MAEVKCPECDAPMVLRTNRKDETQFYGCSTYPDCRGTRAVASDSVDDSEDAPSDRARRNDSRRWRQ